MQTYLFVAQIVLSIGLVFACLLQIKGSGLGGIFGQADTVYRTKRGLEKTLFQLTIVLMVLFMINAVVSIRVGA